MIIIYPKTNQYYYSFYLSYIKKKFKTVKYDSTPFPAFHHHCLAFIILGRYKKKIYIYGIALTDEEKNLVISEAKEILDVEDVIASILLVDNLRIQKN